MSVKLSQNQMIVVGLAAATALIHLVLGVLSGGSFGLIFILNGLGYLGLVAALYFLPQTAGMRPQVRWALIAFTAVTVVLYFVANRAAGLTQPLGMITKVIEVALIAMLWREQK